MGYRRTAWIAVVLASAALFMAGTARGDSDLSVTRYLQNPDLITPVPHPFHTSGLSPVTQDVITEAEYDRLTGVRKRVGVSLFGYFALMGGSNAGRLRVNYSDTFTTSANYEDLFTIEGTSGGIEVSMIVAPAYSVHLGGGFLYHQGKPWKNNDFSDLYRYPIYLALRFNAPLALGFDRWLDFENPEYVTGMLPFVKVKLQATWWNRVELSGSALPFYEASRDYFVQGLYPEIVGSGGVEFRLGALAIFGEVSASFQLINPRLSKYFSKDPTNPDEIIPGAPFEFAIGGGITYYFGSGRIFHVMPDAD
ncbi:MAG: hypothetical protein ACYTFG_08065 [Planctomycetota bacterium]|jgi:hypothetical protein